MLIFGGNRHYAFKTHPEDVGGFISLCKEHRLQGDGRVGKVCTVRSSGSSYTFNILHSLKTPPSTASFGEVAILFVENFIDMPDVLSRVKARYGRQPN